MSILKLKFLTALFLFSAFLLLPLQGLADAKCETEIFNRLSSSEATLGRAEAALEKYPAGSAMRKHIEAGIKKERAIIDELLNDLTSPKGNVSPGRLAEAEKRIAAYEEAAQAPPIEYSAGSHDPKMKGQKDGGMRGGGADNTTVLPADAEQVFQTAIPDPGSGGATWWGKGADGELYRYSGGVQGGVTKVHWNGTTAAGPLAIKPKDIPIEVKRYFGIKG